MMPTDTLTCQVTPDSAEPTSLSCSMPPLEWLDLWAMLGAWATVGATLLLAFFAWKAWNTSQATLKAMEQQLEDQKSSAAEAIEAQRELSIGAGQRALLAEYHVALMDMAEAAAETGSDIEKRVTRATTAWTAWAMEMHIIDPEFRQLTANCHFQFRIRTAAIHIEAQRPSNDDLLESMFKHQDRDILQAEIRDYASRLYVWQADPSRRQEIHAYLKKELSGNEA